MTALTSPAASIVEAFLQNCERPQDEICFEFEERVTTYRLLQAQVLRFAATLSAQGLQAGERVALFLENCPEFIMAYLGIGLAGGVVVLVNSGYKQVELRHILNDAGVRFVLTDTERRAELERVRADLPLLTSIIEMPFGLMDFLEAGEKYSYLPKMPNADDLAVIAYTSGTTGRSKGAMLTHRNLMANIRAVCEAWQWTAADCLLLALPLFHTHGLMVGVHGTLVTGGRMVLCRRFEASHVYNLLLTKPVTLFFGVPTMYSRLLAYATTQNSPPPALRLYVSGSAPLSVQTFEEFQQVFGQNILERYGMTETIMNLSNPYEGERRPGTVGQPFPGQEARVVDVRTRQVLPANTPGEIEVRGPHVFKGYWQQPQATAESFAADGWFRTGDLGHVSPDGYYTISGRAKELIISGGYNVYPREVEEVLQSCPGVREVAVLGWPDADLGEQVVAAIVREDPTLTASALIAFCRDQLAAYKKPRQVFFVEALPRNALGKIQKHLLREQLGQI